MAFLGATSTGHFVCEDTLVQLGRDTGIDGHMSWLLGESRITVQHSTAKAGGKEQLQVVTSHSASPLSMSC